MHTNPTKRILVTGGAGFVGIHLCHYLLTQGHCVTVLDNFYTSKNNNLDKISQFETFNFIEHDVCEPISLNVDEIYHLACPASPVHYQRDPVYTAKINFLGSLNVLELAKNCNAKVLLASTSEIYGNPLEHPQKESYCGNVNTLGPRACYDEGKRISETLFCDFKRQYNTNIRIARIFNTYGPYMQANDGRVISNFILQALNHESITIYGDGMQTRSLCYVEDTIKGLVCLMNSALQSPVNIGNPTELTVLDIANKIIALTQSKSQIVHHPLPQDDPLQRRPDINRAASIGWEPQVDLQVGLVQTINYFKHIRSSVPSNTNAKVNA